MKKKILILILILLGILIFLGITYKIEIIQNLKEIINKQEENTKQITEVTKVDVTNLDSNINIEHEHIYKTMYNETNHWEECTICGEKRNQTSHNLIDNGWTMGGNNNCSESNVHIYMCTCGYNYSTNVNRAAHQFKGIQNTAIFCKYYQCSVCQKINDMHECHKANGSRIKCNNLGVCSVCNYNYTAGFHTKNFDNTKGIFNGTATCELCNTNNIAFVNYTSLEKISEVEYKYHISMTVPNGANTGDIVLLSKFGNNITMSNYVSTSSNTWTNTVTIKFKEHTEIKDNIQVYWPFRVNGTWSQIGFISEIFKADNECPKINNVQIETENDWNKIKTITISGTENYCNTVKIQILDDKQTEIFSGTANVTNNNYIISCIPEIECGANERIFTVIVTDNCGNSTTKEFTIAKTDSIPPEPTSEKEVGREWAKSKKFTFKATDSGIGNVSIAFNDIEDLQLAGFDGAEYSREYEFTGDVYNPKELPVLYKDELGNTSIQKITIDKLDNTSPSITNVNIHNNKLLVEANDIKEGLGEGSGVAKYKYLASTEKLASTDISELTTEVNSNEEIIVENISNTKYIYVVAEDKVGNVSEVYEFEVPQLVLTSKVDLSLTNGKGGIELDWSDYDTTDKYFVIYRKEENSDTWKTIVPLEQKLTGGTYIDILGNDKNSPSAPVINIEESIQNTNIGITSSSTDTGTKYTYYIEAYDSTREQALINISNKVAENT